MRLKINQLETHLKNSTNKPIYVVSGDEPFQKQECIDQIRNHYKKQGFNERVVLNVSKGFDWNLINEANNNLSLFSNQKIIELRMKSPKPGREGGNILQEYAARQNDDTLLIISSDKMDAATKKTKWVKSIDKIGVLIDTWPIEFWQLPSWIQERMRKKGKKIAQDASKLIADKTEGNLLAADQEIEKLALLVEKDNIDIDDVLNTVMDSSRYYVFDMVESAFLGDKKRTVLMLNGLKNEGVEPLAIFGAFMWEYRRLCEIKYKYESGIQLAELFSKHFVWKEQKKRAINAVLKRHSVEELDKLLNYCAKIDKTLTVNPVADAPSANSADVLASDGVEAAVIGSGNTAKIAVDADLTDTDGSEQLSIILKLPAEVSGASFVPGNGDAVVTGTVVTDVSGFDGQRVVSFNVASGQENSGKFEFELLMENHFSGSSSLEVFARSTDGTDIIDTNVGSHSFVITPVADAPILEDGNIIIETGSEDGFDLSGAADPTRVNLSAQYADLSEVHKVIIILDQNSKGVVYNGTTFNATNINVPANITLSGNQKYVLIDVVPSEDGSFTGCLDIDLAIVVVDKSFNNR